MYSSLAKHEWKRGEKTQHEYEYATANENQFDAKKSAKENENFYHKVFYVERKHKKTPPFRSEC